MLLHSRQKRKLICSCLAGASVAEVVEGAGEAMGEFGGVKVWGGGGLGPVHDAVGGGEHAVGVAVSCNSWRCCKKL